MPVTALAQRYLAAYHSGEEVPGGLAFRKAVDQASLDYTPESLGRLDRLLLQIREKLQPTFDDFIAKQENQNFLYLLCFYAGAVVARYTGKPCEWYPHAELVNLLPPEAVADYPECFATSMICVYGGDTFFVPLASMQEILFDVDSQRSLLASAEKFMRRTVGVPVLARPDPTALAALGKLPEDLHRAGEFAGMAVAFAIWQVKEGQPLAPMLSQAFPSGNRLNTTLMQDDLRAAIDAGLKRVKENPDGAALCALIYDGYINLPKFRTDALILEMSAYSPMPVAFSVAVPYRHARSAGGFALFGPRLLSSSGAETAHGQLAAAFFAGLDQFQPAGIWDRHFEPGA